MIEFNPFMVTTDGAMFSWEHERNLFESSGDEMIFRIVEKAKTGSTAMLDSNLRRLMKSVVA